MGGGVEALSGMRREMARIGRILKAAVVIAPLLAASPALADCRIAVLGDSIAAGYGLPVENALPARLEAALRARGYDCTVLDAGVSGDTSAGGRARLDWMLGDDPTHVIVELGGNDALRALPVEQMEDNLDAIITRLKEEGVAVLLAGMLAPPNLGREYGEAFAAVFPRLAEKHDVPLYPFILEGVAAEPDLNQRDGIHPSAEGVAVIVENLLPTVEAWLERTAPQAAG